MSSEFASRFDDVVYVDQQAVRLFRVDRYGNYEANEQVFVPEHIWHRLRLLAAASQLHLLPLFDGSTDPVFLNQAQAETLLGELAFAHELVDDPVLRDLVSALAEMLNLRSQGASKKVVGIEFP